MQAELRETKDKMAEVQNELDMYNLNITQSTKKLKELEESR